MIRTFELEEFSSWLETLRDKQAATRITTRILRLRNANFGDAKAVGDGVFELRFLFGPGYRVYYGRVGEQIVVLLAGGDKATQSRDIIKARNLLQQWKVQQNGTT